MAVSTSVLHMPQGNGQLPADWQWGRLEDLSAGVFDCPHSTPILAEQGPFVVRSQDVRSGIFRSVQAARVSEQTYQERIARAEPRFGDLLFSREGTYFGIAAEVPKNKRVCLGQRMVLIRPNPSILDSRYLRYWLNSSVMVVHMHGHRDGSVAERLNMPTIRGLPVAYPPLREQRAIAHILGTLDDKIELNRRMNETLEAIARALFKSWFMDFDPVRAKAEGRDLALPQPLAALFPDNFEDSELGEIPKGWRVTTLGELSLKPEYGFTASAITKPMGPKFVRITDINKRPWIEWSSVPYCEISEAELEKYRLIAGDILIARMADPGHTTMIEGEVDAVFASYLIRFRPSEPGMARFLQYWLKSDEYWDTVRARQAGTTRASLNAQVLSAFQLAAPPRSVAEAFGTQVLSLRSRIAANVAEAESMAALRDALLPRLISGALRVADAERLVEAAA